MQGVLAALLELASGVALSMAIVAAGSLALKVLSSLLREVEKAGIRI